MRMFVRINGEIHYLWRAVDQEGEVLEAYVTKSRQPREFATEPIWMLDGFNEGWVAFQDGGSRAVKGRTNALAVIAALVTSTERRCSLSARSQGRSTGHHRQSTLPAVGAPVAPHWRSGPASAIRGLIEPPHRQGREMTEAVV